MEYRGKMIEAVRIFNKNKNNELVAYISDNHIETTNGYEIEVINKIAEIKGGRINGQNI